MVRLQTPQESIYYISELYAGRTCDQHIIRDCHLLDRFNPGDQILANRGLPASEEFPAKRAELVIPPAEKTNLSFFVPRPGNHRAVWSFDLYSFMYSWQ